MGTQVSSVEPPPPPMILSLRWGTPEEEQIREASKEYGLGQFETKASLGPAVGDVQLADGIRFWNSGEKSEPKRI